MARRILAALGRVERPVILVCLCYIVLANAAFNPNRRYKHSQHSLRFYLSALTDWDGLKYTHGDPEDWQRSTF